MDGRFTGLKKLGLKTLAAKFVPCKQAGLSPWDVKVFSTGTNILRLLDVSQLHYNHTSKSLCKCKVKGL